MSSVAEDRALRYAKRAGGRVEVEIEEVDGARIYTVRITSRAGGESDRIGVGANFDEAVTMALKWHGTAH